MVKLSQFPFTHSILIFLGNYLPKHNYENRQTGWVRILHKCRVIFAIVNIEAHLIVKRHVEIGKFSQTTQAEKSVQSPTPER